MLASLLGKKKTMCVLSPDPCRRAGSMLWLNQECGCQKLDLEPGARDRVGPPLLPPLGLG